MNAEQGWWYCLKHHTVEPYDSDCPGKDRLGPYPTREAAAHALETVQERNKEWDAKELTFARHARSSRLGL